MREGAVEGGRRERRREERMRKEGGKEGRKKGGKEGGKEGLYSIKKYSRKSEIKGKKGATQRLFTAT